MLKFDTRNLQRQLQQAAQNMMQQKSKEIEEVVESQYCATHGKFAVIENMNMKTGENSGLDFSYSVCCEELECKVRSCLTELDFKE